MSIVRLPVGSLLKTDKAPKKRRQTAREHNDGHLAFIRSLPCVITGRQAEAAHVRFASKLHGKPITGKGIKPDDRWCLPLCHEEHMAQHSHGDEWGWWQSKGIQDPLVLCMRLWEVSGDYEAGMRVIRDAQQLVRQ